MTGAEGAAYSNFKPVKVNGVFVPELALFPVVIPAHIQKPRPAPTPTAKLPLIPGSLGFEPVLVPPEELPDSKATGGPSSIQSLINTIRYQQRRMQARAIGLRSVEVSDVKSGSNSTLGDGERNPVSESPHTRTRAPRRQEEQLVLLRRPSSRGQTPRPAVRSPIAHRNRGATTPRRQQIALGQAGPHEDLSQPGRTHPGKSCEHWKCIRSSPRRSTSHPTIGFSLCKLWRRHKDRR
jgi:hypothetical protein